MPGSFYQKPKEQQLGVLAWHRPGRGFFGELLIPEVDQSLLEEAPGALADAVRTVRSLIQRGMLPADDIFWNDEIGHSIGVELYGYYHELCLIQVRHVRRDIGMSRQKSKLNYFCTDGIDLAAVSANRIKPEISRDPDPASALRAVWTQLPAAWRTKYGCPQRLQRPGFRSEPVGMRTRAASRFA